MAYVDIFRVTIPLTGTVGANLFVGATGVVGAGLIDGVTQFGGVSGDQVEAITVGVAEVVAGETLVVGDKVTANASGQAIKTGGVFTVLKGASSGGLAEILIK